jgi:hypothetical protein
MIPPDINCSQNETVNPSAQLYGATKHGSFRVPKMRTVVSRPKILTRETLQGRPWGVICQKMFDSWVSNVMKITIIDVTFKI